METPNLSPERKKSELEILTEKFVSLKDSLVGETAAEKVSSFAKALFSEEEASEKAEVLANLAYYQELEEAKGFYHDKELQKDLARKFWQEGSSFGSLTEFLDSDIRFGSLSPKVKEGYFYKEFVKSIEESHDSLQDFRGMGIGGIGLLG